MAIRNLVERLTNRGRPPSEPGKQPHSALGFLDGVIPGNVLRNPQIRLYWVINQPKPIETIWNQIKDAGIHQNIYRGYSSQAQELILDICAIAEQRRSGRELGIPIVLIIRNTQGFVKRSSLDFGVKTHLNWLIKRNGKTGVYLVDAILQGGNLQFRLSR